MNIDDIKGKIIAVDIDETLTNEVAWEKEDIVKSTIDEEMVEKINRLARQNFILIYTARRDHLIPDTLKWLRRWGIESHGFNNQKPPFDYYIDQKNLRKEDLQ